MRKGIPTGLRRGAFVAWLTFMVLLVVTMVTTTLIGEAVAGSGSTGTGTGYGPLPQIILLVVFYTVVFGGAVSGLIVAAALPLVTRVDDALPVDATASRRVWTFAGLGAVAGVVGAAVLTGLLALIGNDPVLVFFSPITLVGAAMAAIAAAVGRWYPLRRARSRRV